MSAPTYEQEQIEMMVAEDRADERRRDAQDALRAGREQDAVMCAECGLEINDFETGDESLHFACYCQREAVQTLREKAEECGENLLAAVEDYEHERRYKSAHDAPEKAADMLFAKRLRYLTFAIDPKSHETAMAREHLLTVVKLLLYSMSDEAKTRQPANAQHAATAKTREQMQLSTAINALEQM